VFICYLFIFVVVIPCAPDFLSRIIVPCVLILLLSYSGQLNVFMYILQEVIFKDGLL